jgi:hypothetical protein
LLTATDLLRVRRSQEGPGSRWNFVPLRIEVAAILLESMRCGAVNNAIRSAAVELACGCHGHQPFGEYTLNYNLELCA